MADARASRCSRSQVSVPNAAREVGVHLGHATTQPVRLGGEVAAGVAGVSRPAVAEEAAQAGQGQVEAVAGGPQELLEDAELHAPRRIAGSAVST